MTRGILERWKRRWRTVNHGVDTADHVAREAAAAPTTAVPVPAAPPIVELDLERMIAQEFPAEFPIAAHAAAQTIDALAGSDLSSLARRSPSLKGYDWSNYLRCSICRVVRVQAALRATVAAGARVLDFGSYFGNFALAARTMGFDVHAVDAYSAYEGALARWVALQQAAGVAVHDFADTGYDLRRMAAAPFDAVICAGVIEHLPHTPRPLFDTLNGVLKPGGILVLDTPNLAYLYKRLALLEGRSVFAPLEQQYFTELPFEGHHREYTVAEVEWMLRAAGHQPVTIETFNYSMFGTTYLSGEHAEYFHAMADDPSLRELILSVSRRL